MSPEGHRPYDPTVMQRIAAGEAIPSVRRTQLKLNTTLAPGQQYPWEVPPPPPGSPDGPGPHPERTDLRSGIPELQMATTGAAKAITRFRLGRTVASAEKLEDKVNGRHYVADKIEEPKKGWTGYNKPDNPVRPTTYMEKRRARHMENIQRRRRENANRMARLAMGQPKPGTRLSWGDSIHKAKVNGAIATREVRDSYLGARFDWKGGAPIKQYRLERKKAKIARLQRKMH